MAFGSEVGTGHVSIFPVMNGFRNAVNKEMQQSGKSGASRFGKAFGTGKDIGRSFGSRFRQGFDGGTKGMAETALKPLRRDLAQATSKASSALLNYKAAQVQTTAAQDRLNEAVERYGPNSTQAQAAAIRLEQAQLREAQALEKSNDAAERKADAARALKAAESELAGTADKTSLSFKTMAGSFANGVMSIERGRSSFTGLAGALGGLVNALLGVDAIWKPLGSRIAGFASTAFQKISGFAAQAGAKIRDGLKGAVQVVQNLATGMGAKIRGAASTAASAMAKPFAALGSKLAGPMRTAVSAVTKPFQLIGSKLAGPATAAANAIAKPFKTVGNAIGAPLKAVAGTVGNYFKGIGSAAAGVFAKLPPGAQTAAGAIGGALGGMASAASDSFKSLASSALSHVKGLATGAVAAVTAGAAALGGTVLATGKQALEAYATYEQAVGGVDTLFKDASGTVQRYAADAYKTAGVSANDYMNQVTSFAASLVSSLGGDTAAAAESANTALVDMSDNANKMGTDLGSLQFAYQGFAKQNYTMLDNLKLGRLALAA